MSRRRDSGFTLVELLVAIAVFAVLALAAYAGLDSVLTTREATDRQAARLDALQRTFVQLGADLEQIVNRPVRDELGDTQEAVVYREGDERLLEFSRTGWPNPTGLPRSHLQRVVYRLDEDQLLRVNWYDLDRVQGAPVRERLLLTDVDKVALRFLDAQREWHDQWPPLDVEEQANALPAAIEVSLELPDWGRIARTFALAG